MLEVWTWPTPNGHKVHIALEELGLEYKVIPIDIGAGDQFKPEFLKITPNHRIPAIVDPDGPGGKPFTLFESAAILIYLSEKSGGKLIPKDPIGRYTNEVARLSRVLNHRLEESPWLAGDEYSMADIITFPWIRNAAQSSPRFAERGTIDLAEYPAMKRWYDEMAARPAVQRGLAVLAEGPGQRPITEAERENMFGATQFAAR